MPAWGLLLDRYGNKPVMIVSLLLWQISNFFWCFIVPSNQALLYVLWLWAGATSAGFVLGQFTLLLRLLPLEAKNLAIGVNLAVTSVFAAVAPIAGGYLLEWALGRTGDRLAVYHACFLIQPVLALGGAFLLFRVHEPAASPLSAVVGAMRNIRTLGGVLGLSFLTNYFFMKRSHDRGSPLGGPGAAPAQPPKAARNPSTSPLDGMPD
jgi:MFS family permease